MVARDNVRFVAAFMTEFLDVRLHDGRLTTDDHRRLRKQIEKDAAGFARKLFGSRSGRTTYQKAVYRLCELREPDGRLFPFIQLLPPRTGKRRVTCFVGHRFDEHVEKSLRYNLTHLFEPYRIDIRWSGYDLTARDIFTDVVASIRRADMCIFDNLGTLNRPNVYIEIGIAYALRRPMIVCEYEGRRYRRAGLETGSVPTDLEALMTVRYSSYERLCRQLYFKLPRFLERHRLL